jgi:PrtD family type I secretion system ABC transporter
MRINSSDQPSPVAQTLRACRGAFGVLMGFSLATNLLTLASPLYMMQVFDHVLSSRSGDTLLMLTLITTLALAVLCALEAIRSELLVRIGDWLDDRLGPSVFGGALWLSLRSNDSGRAAQSMRDLGSLRNFITGASILPLLDAPWTPIFVLALFSLHWLLGLIGVAGAAVLFGLALLNEIATRGPLRTANAAHLRTAQRADTAMRNAEVIRAMGMADGIMRRWRIESNDSGRAQRQAGTRGVLVLNLSRWCRFMIQTMILGVGAWLVIKHEASAGAMFASSFLLGRALAPVENAIGTWKSLVSARLAYTRVTELLTAARPFAQSGMTLPPPKGDLLIDRVTFVPPGAEEPTLRGIHFALPAGEALGVVGPSAAGKSTLARLIAGTWMPTSGKVRLDNADINVWHDAGGSRYIGYLPQDIELFAGTIKDNIARFGEADPEEIIAAASLAGLHETIMGLPRGYDSEIGEGGFKLSGGQRQRVGLARAVFGDPRLVILDEPNASLDHEGEEALQRTIAELKRRGTTVVMIAHRPMMLGLADKLLVLRNGMMELYGGRAEVIARLNAGMRPAAVPMQKQSA